MKIFRIITVSNIFNLETGDRYIDGSNPVYSMKYLCFTCRYLDCMIYVSLGKERAHFGVVLDVLLEKKLWNKAKESSRARPDNIIKSSGKIFTFYSCV